MFHFTLNKEGSVPADEFKELMMKYRWVGFDLDSTLAYNKGFKGWSHIGEPIKPMIDLAKKYIEMGVKVKVFTARASPESLGCSKIKFEQLEKVIQDWTEKHIGQRLEVIDHKDAFMIKSYDDSIVQVVPNTGEILGGARAETFKKVFSKEELEKDMQKGTEKATEALMSLMPQM